MAKSTASGIEHYLEHIVHDMRAISEIRSYSTIEPEKLLNAFNDKTIVSTFTANKDFKVNNLVGKQLPEWTEEELNRRKQANNSGEATGIQQAAWFSKVMPAEPGNKESLFSFIMVVPFKSNHRERYLGCVVSFDWLIDKYISPLRLSEHDFAWVLDGSGRLIYHHRHKDMLLRNIRNFNEDCKSCHTSFEVQKNMLVSGTAVDEYTIKGEPSKIMAYAPINLNSEKWILAVSTYLPYVTSDVMDNFIVVFIISGIFVVVIIGFGFTAYNLNLKRIRAEEAEKQLEQAQNFQEKLNQAAKLASIGELVDSVAHEINTPTGIISAVSSTLEMEDCAQAKCAGELEKIKNQTRRIGNYTKSLLGFSRRMPFNPTSNNLTELIEECIFLVSPKLRASSTEIEKKIIQRYY